MTGEVIDWVLRVVMGGLTVLVFLWGRNQKQAEDLIAERAAAIERALALELRLRDQRLDTLEARMNRAGQHASDAADKVQDVIARLIKVEQRP